MRKITIFNYIAGAMLLLCLSMSAFAQDVKPASRITLGGFHPLTCPQGFLQNRDLWVDTVSNETWIATSQTKWRLAPTQLGKGQKGDKGDTGANGTNGVDGKDGSVGPIGPIGPQGPQGEVGPQGPAGSGSGSVGNIGFVRFVTTVTELNNAWAGYLNGSVRSIQVAGDITLNQSLIIPANYKRQLEIQGHGGEWTIPSNIAVGIGREYASLSEANAGIDCQLRITNLTFKTSNRLNKAIDVQATYGSEIKGCNFYNFETAIKTGWMMGTIIDQCYFWENNISIDYDYARFSGGSSSASQSNHSSITNCKFRHSAGQFGAIKATAVSGLVIEHNIFEGVQSGPQYEVFFDDAGSPVVKEVHIYGNHVEQQPSVAGFHIRLKDGNAYVGGIYSQYDCSLISFESAGYAKMIVENIPYLTSGTKFKNLNGAGRWKFINLPATFNYSDATKWNGTPPINSAIDGWQQNGQSNYLQGITVK